MIFRNFRALFTAGVCVSTIYPCTGVPQNEVMVLADEAVLYACILHALLKFTRVPEAPTRGHQAR